MQPASFADSNNLSTFTSSSPYAIFLDIVSLNKDGDWLTIEIEDLRCFNEKLETLIPSIRISPDVWL